MNKVLIAKILNTLFTLTVIGAVIALSMLGKLDTVISFLDTDELSIKIGSARISVFIVIKTLFTVTVVIWFTGVISSFGERRIEHFTRVKKGNRQLLTKGFQIILYLIAFMITLDVMGIDLKALTVFSGAIGIGIGFGLQKITSNFISGIILLMERSVKLDDLIELTDGTIGYVRRTNARYTVVETFDNKEVIIPNEEFIINRVTNLTMSNNVARIEIQVGVAYESDIHLVQNLIIEAAMEHPRCIKDPIPSCYLTTFADSSVNFRLFFWISDVQEGRLGPQSDVMFAIWNKFKEHHITIPFPQRDIHIIDNSSNKPSKGKTKRIVPKQPVKQQPSSKKLKTRME